MFFLVLEIEELNGLFSSKAKAISACRFRQALRPSKNLFTAKKASQNFRREWRKKIKSVISGGVYVGNDTSHDGRGRASVMQHPCQKAQRAFLTAISACRFRQALITVSMYSLTRAVRARPFFLSPESVNQTIQPHFRQRNTLRACGRPRSLRQKSRPSVL